MKELLFSLTRKDFRWTYHHGSGAGGQKRNKTKNAVRCHHDASGALGHAQESRSIHENEKMAFIRMSKTKEFMSWHRLEVAKKTGELVRIEEWIDNELKNNVKVEVFKNGKWQEWVDED